MKRSPIVVLLVATGVAASAWAKSPKKVEVPRLVCPAQFVYVRTMDGDLMLPRILPEDRDAAYRVEDQLSNWNRYVLVYEPQQADLVFVVRTGRLATVDGNVGVQQGVPDQTGPGQPVGAGPRGTNRDPSDASQGPGDPSQNPANPGSDRRGTTLGAGGSVGPPDDLLAIYTKPGNVDSQAPIWQQTLKDGLAAPDVPLFQQIRTAIEQTCHDQPADKPANSPNNPSKPK
ncbi:MAG TPA: hypothetical protein VKT75_08095 [Acidobacteriaceae bacterium]|nr:hypothetical protein [Acidobacteriaceae bacterium]